MSFSQQVRLPSFPELATQWVAGFVRWGGGVRPQRKCASGRNGAILRWSAVCFALFALRVHAGNGVTGFGQNEPGGRARAALFSALAGPPNFVRIHAGEAGAELGEKARVHEAFLAQEEAGDAAYQIGVWRVLALSASSAEAAAPWTHRIERVIDAPQSAALLHAVESLNKLGVTLRGERLAELRRKMAERSEADLVFLHWAEYLAGDATGLERITAALFSPVPAARARAAFVLGQLRPASTAIQQKLSAAVKREPAGTVTRVFVLAAALTLQADQAEAPTWRAELEEVLNRGGSDVARYYAVKALALGYRREDLPRLERLLDEATGDARVGLAWAILDILNRRT